MIDIDSLKFIDFNFIRKQSFIDFDLYVYNPNSKQADLFLYKASAIEPHHHELLEFIIKNGGLVAVAKNQASYLPPNVLRDQINSISSEVKSAFAKAFAQESFLDIIKLLKEELLLPQNISPSVSASRELIEKLFHEDSYSNRILVTAYLLYKSMSPIDREDVSNLIIASYVHHIGVSQINRSTTLKPHTQFNAQEYRDYQKHVGYSHFLIRKLNPSISSEVLRLVYSHHENINGTGYPAQLKGEQLDLLSTILSFSSHIFEYSYGHITGTSQTLQSVIQAYKDKIFLNGLNFLYSESLISTIIELTNIIHLKEKDSSRVA